MDETDQLDSAIARIGQKSRSELLLRFNTISQSDSYLLRIVLKHAGPVLAELIGKIAKYEKILGLDDVVRAGELEEMRTRDQQ